MFKFTPELLLRIGVAFSFAYPPISALINPYAWVGYFPLFISSLPIDMMLLLHIFGVCEIILALWILFAKKVALPAWIAAGVLGVIVTLNLSQIDVLFRDIPILLMAVALALFPIHNDK